MFLHGRVGNTLLKPYFENANIGVSYVPITSYYNVQPPTKTFEYALSGLFTIATATDENKKVVSPTNGILIEDNAQAFCNALEWLDENRSNLREIEIRQSLVEYRWDLLIKKYMLPILNTL